MPCDLPTDIFQYLPFSLMIAYLMKSSERDVFKYWGGGGNSNASGKFELDTIKGFAQVSVSNF